MPTISGEAGTGKTTALIGMIVNDLLTGSGKRVGVLAPTAMETQKLYTRVLDATGGVTAHNGNHLVALNPAPYKVHGQTLTSLYIDESDRVDPTVIDAALVTAPKTRIWETITTNKKAKQWKPAITDHGNVTGYITHKQLADMYYAGAKLENYTWTETSPSATVIDTWDDVDANAIKFKVKYPKPAEHVEEKKKTIAEVWAEKKAEEKLVKLEGVKSFEVNVTEWFD